MDAIIRTRMLEMVGEYSHAGQAILQFNHDLAALRMKRAIRDSELMEPLLGVWALSKSNETTRKADMEAKQLTDPAWREYSEGIQACEEGIKLQQAIGDGLRFESALMISIVTAEGTSDPRD